MNVNVATVIPASALYQTPLDNISATASILLKNRPQNKLMQARSGLERNAGTSSPQTQSVRPSSCSILTLSALTGHFDIFNEWGKLCPS